MIQLTCHKLDKPAVKIAFQSLITVKAKQVETTGRRRTGAVLHSALLRLCAAAATTTGAHQPAEVTLDLLPSPAPFIGGRGCGGGVRRNREGPMSVESSDGNKHRGEDGGPGRKTFQHLG